MENWKDINDYYAVSNDGTVKSLERVIIRGNGRPQTIKEKILRRRLRNDGYLDVWLSNNGEDEQKLVHVLVAQAFIPNPNNYEHVHHRNHIKTDNRVENLEWISEKEHHALHNKESKSKVVYQYTLDGLLVNVWESACEAARVLGFDQGHICDCCRGKYKKHKGYKWSYTPL